MTKRNFIIIALFVISALLLFFTNKKEAEKKQLHNYLFKSLSIEKVKSISIKNYEIKKEKKDLWKIGTRECNKHKIEYLINYLKNIDFKNIISNNKNNYKNFKVDNKNAIKLTIKTNSKTFNIWIGKFTPDGNGCYVRLDDGNVYLITKNLTFEFDKDEKYFYLEDNQFKKANDNSSNSSEKQQENKTGG